MNQNTVSTECGHGMHSACAFESCACECHILNEGGDPYDVDEDDD